MGGEDRPTIYAIYGVSNSGLFKNSNSTQHNSMFKAYIGLYIQRVCTPHSEFVEIHVAHGTWGQLREQDSISV